MSIFARFFLKKKVQINGPVVGGARGGDFAGTFHQPFEKCLQEPKYARLQLQFLRAGGFGASAYNVEKVRWRRGLHNV